MIKRNCPTWRIRFLATRRFRMKYSTLATRTFLQAIFLFILVACQGLGPRAVKVGMPAYNTAINDTGHQILLLNLVRMRYSESPYFMEISNVFAAPNLTAGASALGSFGGGSSAGAILGGELFYSESPVIVYTPLSGESFVRRLLQPIGLENIGLLHQGGWNLDLILRLCVERINNVWNAESSAGFSAAKPHPEYEKFQRVVKILASLEKDRLLDVISENRGVEQGKGTQGADKKQGKFLEFSIDARVKQEKNVTQLLKDLQLDPNAESYYLTTLQTYKEGRTLTIVTRPLAATMIYLSMGISVPPSDLAKGVVPITMDDDGKPFDWRRVTQDIFAVKSSETQPDDVFVAVQYRDNWFYIENNDVKSKNTLAMFEILLALRAGETPENRTPLTIPIR